MRVWAVLQSLAGARGSDEGLPRDASLPKVILVGSPNVGKSLMVLG
jgi:GTP-binding protein EngB required for normal cell division